MSESVRVEWDDAKNRSNQKKHGVSFETARELVQTGDYLQIFDPYHSADEDRLICLGLVRGRVLLVVTTEPEDDLVRIVSARWATGREARLFGEFVRRGK